MAAVLLYTTKCKYLAWLENGKLQQTRYRVVQLLIIVYGASTNLGDYGCIFFCINYSSDSVNSSSSPSSTFEIIFFIFSNHYFIIYIIYFICYLFIFYYFSELCWCPSFFIYFDQSIIKFCFVTHFYSIIISYVMSLYYIHHHMQTNRIANLVDFCRIAFKLLDSLS